MQERIIEELKAIEARHNVRVLYACESGSRAWGFPSHDSDFDVRFFYLRPRDWYLSIDGEHQRDVIEQPIAEALDISGWDFRKALGLFRKSNPPLLEWLDSPIVYSDNFGIAGQMRALMPQIYSPTSSAYHYWQMARKNAAAYLKGDLVRAKKYFYVLRPLLAVRWIEAHQSAPPTPFEKLLELLENEDLRAAIEDLMERKKHGLESDAEPRLEIFHQWIEAELERHENGFRFRETKSDIEPLNELFRATLKTVW